MKNSKLTLITFICLFVISCIAIETRAGVSDQEKTAKKILDATGIQGGFIVHVGCGDGKLTAALRADDSYLVHGLDKDAKSVEQARRFIQSLGLYGKVSVEQCKGGRLPYVDNLVNLLVSEDLGDISMDEVMRVLCPNGVAYIKKGRNFRKIVKKRPKELDDWTHYLHDASNNAVSLDTIVAPPRGLQWTCGPEYARSHEHFGSVSAMVTSGGRVFYIIDEGPI
ncbi:MAG: class I SAM-dependent methyltransferase, partial [Planctomycetota bacterium]